MRVQRPRYWRCLFVLAAAIHLNAQQSLSELGPACDLPAEVGASVSVLSPADAYGAAGAWFAQHAQSKCAMKAFELSIRLDPKTWQSEYNLALLQISAGSIAEAERHLRHVVSAMPELVPARNALSVTLRRLNRPKEAEIELRQGLKIKSDSPELLSSLADLLASENRYSAAIEYWTRASQLDPANSQIKLSLAIALNENNQSQKAIDLLRALIAAQPDLAVAHFNLGTIYARQSNYRLAAEQFREGLKLDPGDDVDRLSLAKSLVLLGENQEASDILPAYIAHHEGDFEGHYLLGDAYRGLADYAKAEPELRAALKLNPDHSDLNYNLGFVLAHTGRSREALPLFQKAISLDPEAQSPRFAMAAALQSLGQGDRAQDIYSQLREDKQKGVRKDQASTQSNLANQFLQNNQPLKAAEIYRQMIQLDPGNARTYYNLALALDQAGDKQAERSALNDAIRFDPKLAKALNQLGFLELSEGNLSEAERRLKAATDLDPQFAEAQANLGVLYGRRGELAKAEQCFRSAVENDAHFARAYTNLALILAQQGRFTEAEAQARQAVNLDSSDAGAFTALGMIQTRLRKGSDAVASFRRAVRTQPDNPDFHLNLGIALADRYDLDGALAEFSETVRLAPQSAIGYYNRGRVLVDKHRFIEGEADLQRAIQLPGAPPDALYLLAIALRQQGQIERSYSVAEKLITLDGQSAKAYFLLGQDLMSLNRETDAINAWRKAAEIDPNRTEVLYRLSQALRKTDTAEANRYAEQLRNHLKQSQALSEADTLGNLALSAAERHDFGQAISQLEEALTVCGDCHDKADLYKDLGLIFCQSGDLEHAELQLKKALLLKPQDPEIMSALTLVSNDERARPR